MRGAALFRIRSIRAACAAIGKADTPRLSGYRPQADTPDDLRFAIALRSSPRAAWRRTEKIIAKAQTDKSNSQFYAF